jgi:RimJ/RimL family protein N-acetyltransferase
MPSPSDVDIWPLLGVRMSVSDIELTPIDDRTALALGRLAAGGIHGNFLPFNTPWTRGTEVEVARNVYRYHSRLRHEMSPETWSLEFAARLDGTLIGVQSLTAEHFPTTRSAESASWLGQAWQGKGIGTLNRIAVLTLAFDGLGADEVTTSAWADNVASNAVTRMLGYEENGEERLDREGLVTVQKRFRMSRQMWDARGADLRPHVQLDGVEALRDWLAIG